MKKHISVIAMLILVMPVLRAEPAVLLDKAESLFKEAGEELQEQRKMNLFLEAASLYERTAKETGGNGKLYYNAGNAYLRGGDTGRAVLNYRKALLYRPFDGNLRSNLEYARSKQQNSFTETVENRITALLLFPLEAVPPAAAAVLLVLSSLVLWGSLILKFFVAGGKKIVAVPLLAMVFSVSVLGTGAWESSRVYGVVTAESAVGRNGDSRGYEPTFSEPLYSGVEFRVVESRAGWYLVRLVSGDMTWIESSRCSLVEAGSQRIGTEKLAFMPGQ